MSLHMNSILCSQLFMYIAYDVCFFCASQMKMRPYANKCFAFVIAFIIFQRWWTIETFNFICAGVCKKRAIEKFMRCYTFWCDIKCMCATASVGGAAVTVIIVNGTYVMVSHGFWILERCSYVIQSDLKIGRKCRSCYSGAHNFAWQWQPYTNSLTHTYTHIQKQHQDDKYKQSTICYLIFMGISWYCTLWFGVNKCVDVSFCFDAFNLAVFVTLVLIHSVLSVCVVVCVTSAINMGLHVTSCFSKHFFNRIKFYITIT